MNMNFFLSFFLSSSVFCLVLSLGKVYRKFFDCVRNPEMFSNVDMDERAYPRLCTQGKKNTLYRSLHLCNVGTNSKSVDSPLR